MQNITVDKDRLLKTLKTNRDEHRDLFLQAQGVFRQKVIEALDERLARARGGEKVELFISLREPQDYTEEFDRTISMIEWSQGDTMDLSEKDFQRYVLNKWEWAEAFASSTAQYLQT